MRAAGKFEGLDPLAAEAGRADIDVLRVAEKIHAGLLQVDQRHIHGVEGDVLNDYVSLGQDGIDDPGERLDPVGNHGDADPVQRPAPDHPDQAVADHFHLGSHAPQHVDQIHDLGGDVGILDDGLPFGHCTAQKRRFGAAHGRDGEIDNGGEQLGAADLDVVLPLRDDAPHLLPDHHVQVVLALADLAAAGVRYPGDAVADQLARHEQVGGSEAVIVVIQALAAQIGGGQADQALLGAQIDRDAKGLKKGHLLPHIHQLGGKVHQVGRLFGEKRRGKKLYGRVLGPADADSSHRPLPAAYLEEI